MTQNINDFNPIHIDHYDKPPLEAPQIEIDTETTKSSTINTEEIHENRLGKHKEAVGMHENRQRKFEEAVGMLKDRLGEHEEAGETLEDRGGEHEEVGGKLEEVQENQHSIVINKTNPKMASKRHYSEVETQEQYRVALNNVEQQEEIVAAMTEFGYDTAAIAEGKLLFTNMRKAWELNQQEDNETLESKINLNAIRETVAEDYSLDRKKAKVIFKNDPLVLQKLALTGSVPKAYIKWVECMKTFYKGLNAESALATKLSRFKFSAEDLAARLANLQELEYARSQYLKEIGESQEATRAKDLSFAEIDKWMSEFYAVAKIAMNNKPQLLESLGILVRN